MLMLAIKWLLPLIAVGFLAGVMFRMRYQIGVAIALGLGGIFYYFNYQYSADANTAALYFVLTVPMFVVAYAAGALFGKFVQSEVKGRPVMLTLSLVTVGLFLITMSNSAVYR